MVTVKVVWQATGRPASGARVALGLWDGTITEHTDGEGEAHFTTANPGDYEVYVDGKTVYKGRLEGRRVIYI